MKYLAQNLILTIHTARHLSVHQVFCRLRFIARKSLWDLTGRKVPPCAPLPLSAFNPLWIGASAITDDGLGALGYKEAVSRAEALAQGRFGFLNQEVAYPGDVAWNDHHVSQLWRYHLHYFDYVSDMMILAALGRDALAWDTFRRLADSWIRNNQKLSGDGWHPFTISVRVVNWVEAFHFWRTRFKEEREFERRFLASLHAQTAILASSLEYDVRGNHLIKNLRGLIWGGLAFEDDKAERWLRTGIALLEKELDEQVLPDGGHFERAPGYHEAVLKDCLEIAVVLQRNMPGVSYSWLDKTLRQMLKYLVSVLPESADLPLIKDTAWDAAPAPKDLLAAGALYFDDPAFKISEEINLYPRMIFPKEAADLLKNRPANPRELPSTALRKSGFYIMRNLEGSDHMIIDGGKVCPDYLPAHAHADMFSYELTAWGKRVVVDSGVHSYSAGPWRDYFRSTRAHNTVEVAGQDQSEVWGSFRVARRARPLDVEWRPEERRALFQGRHDGYRRLAVPVIHRRIVVWEADLFWLVVDELKGNGVTRAESHVHLHPHIMPEKSGEWSWRLNGSPSPLWVHAFGATGSFVTRGQTTPFIQGWYSEQFGIRVPNSVITLQYDGALPFLLGYAIATEERFLVDWVRQEKNALDLTFRTGGRTFTLSVLSEEVRYHA